MLQPALLGGLFIGVLSALPFIGWANCCCLWIVGGGFLAAYLRQQNDARPLTSGVGAAVGLGAGAIGPFVWLVVSLALDAVLAPVKQAMLGEVIRVARDLPPETRELLESMASNENAALGYLFGFLFLLLVGVPFATLGGVLGAAFFRNDVPPALGGPIAPPPLPPLA